MTITRASADVRKCTNNYGSEPECIRPKVEGSIVQMSVDIWRFLSPATRIFFVRQRTFLRSPADRSFTRLTAERSSQRLTAEPAFRLTDSRYLPTTGSQHVFEMTDSLIVFQLIDTRPVFPMTNSRSVFRTTDSRPSLPTTDSRINIVDGKPNVILNDTQPKITWRSPDWLAARPDWTCRQGIGTVWTFRQIINSYSPYPRSPAWARSTPPPVVWSVCLWSWRVPSVGGSRRPARSTPSATVKQTNYVPIRARERSRPIFLLILISKEIYRKLRVIRIIA